MLAASLFAQAATASAEAGPRERRLFDAFEAHLAGGDVVGAEALAPLVERASPGARRSALLGTLDLFAGRLASAEQRLSEAWQAEDRSQPSLAGALCEQVTVCLMQGRGDEAVLWGRRAVEVSEGNLHAHDRARGHLALALVWTYRVREALALLEQLPGPSGKLAADDLDPLIFRGTARLWAGYPELAFPDLSHAAARLRGGSSARYAPMCLTYLACAEYLLGAWDDALAHAELSVALVRDAGYAMWSPLAHQDATLVPIGRGDFGLAARHIEAANAAAALLGGAWADTVTAEAALALARGTPGDALHAVAQVREGWKGKWFGITGLLDWRSLEVEALVALAQPEVAAQRLSELEQLQGDGASPLASASTARLRALLSMAQGDRAAASRAFATAWEHASGLRVPLVLAQLEMDEARFLRQSGQRKRALARLRSASARLAALGARPYAQLCDQELARCQAQPRPGETRRELGLTTAEFAVARAVRKGPDQQRSRGRALSQREDDRVPSLAHLHEARHPVAAGARPASRRPGAGPAQRPQMKERPTDTEPLRRCHPGQPSRTRTGPEGAARARELPTVHSPRGGGPPATPARNRERRRRRLAWASSPAKGGGNHDTNDKGPGLGNDPREGRTGPGKTGDHHWRHRAGRC